MLLLLLLLNLRLLQFDIQVFLRVGPMRLVIPIHVSNIQFKVLVRAVLSMVDTIPCIGGATVTLLSMPHFDFTLRLFNGPDMMAIPGVSEAIRWAVGVSLCDLRGGACS